ncbi:CheY-like chemotaxis protein [Azospirillum fermentarium]|uniref:response regulator n=1 Tax=Azospirillum fermentarium TaxID=1233114 RepID=UPI002226FBE8|nr:response regulator [Azospirillum fermentarium]MCW2246332.1 CheY-like chemotaxis protein [Azospirillum fermentarium]
MAARIDVNSPTLEASAVDSYDVDALLFELGADAGAQDEGVPVCTEPQHLFTSTARFFAADALADFLDGQRLTPTEMLHRVTPLCAFQEWHRRRAVLERIAHAQAKPGHRNAQIRVEEVLDLEKGVIELAKQRGHRGPAPGFDARTFGAAVSGAFQGGPDFDARYALDSLVSSWLADSTSYEVKLVRLLSLESDGLSREGIAVIDQVIGEILASRAGVEELFGWCKGLHPLLDALVQVWKGDGVLGDGAPVVLRRLAAFVGRRRAPGARRGLEMSLHRVLIGTQRLTPPNSYDPRALSTILDEMLATGAVASRLRTTGGYIGGDRTRRILDRRIARLLTPDKLDAVLQDKTHYARLIDLFTLESATFGDQSRKMIAAAIQKHLEQRELTQRLFEGMRTPRARIKALSDLHRRLLRSGLPESLRDSFGRMLDELQYLYLRTNRILARLACDKKPAVEEVMDFAALLAENAFTEPKCAAAIRMLIGHHTRSPSFLRAYLNHWREKAERDGLAAGADERSSIFQALFTTLAEAGVPLKDMADLRVLLAEDESQARAYVRMILRDLGVVAITEAEDGHAALSCFTGHEADFDIIICDWKMPRLSGLEFLKMVRAVRPDMPFLMVTGLATMIAVEEAMAHDVTAYIAKPFAPEQLEEKLLILVNRDPALPAKP